MKNIPANALYPCTHADVDSDLYIHLILNISTVYAVLPARLVIGKTSDGNLLLLRVTAPDNETYKRNLVLAHVAVEGDFISVMHGETRTPYPDIRRALIGLYAIAAKIEPLHRAEILAAQKFERQRCDAFENFIRSSDAIAIHVNRDFGKLEVRATFLDIPGIATIFRKVLSHPIDCHPRIHVPNPSNVTGVSEILAIEKADSGRLALKIDRRRRRWFQDHDHAWKALLRSARRHPAIAGPCSGHQMMQIGDLSRPGSPSSVLAKSIADFERQSASLFATVNGRHQASDHVI